MKKKELLQLIKANQTIISNWNLLTIVKSHDNYQDGYLDEKD